MISNQVGRGGSRLLPSSMIEPKKDQQLMVEYYDDETKKKAIQRMLPIQQRRPSGAYDTISQLQREQIGPVPRQKRTMQPAKPHLRRLSLSTDYTTPPPGLPAPSPPAATNWLSIPNTPAPPLTGLSSLCSV